MSPRPRPARSAQQLGDLVDTGWAYVSGVRLRALVWTLGIAGMTFAAIALTSIAWVPVVGVGAAALVVSVHKLTARLRKPICWSCGHDLGKEPQITYGIRCPSCGTLNQPVRPEPSEQELLDLSTRYEDEKNA